MRPPADAAGNVVSLVADDGTHCAEVWGGDGGVAETVMMADLGVGSLHQPPEPAIAGDVLYASTRDASGLVGGLWRANGIAAGAIALGTFYGPPSGMAAVGSTKYFVATATYFVAAGTASQVAFSSTLPLLCDVVSIFAEEAAKAGQPGEASELDSAAARTVVGGERPPARRWRNRGSSGRAYPSGRGPSSVRSPAQGGAVALTMPRASGTVVAMMLNVRGVAIAFLSWLPIAMAVAQGKSAASAGPAHVLHWNVAVLVFEGVELLDFAGPVEAFTQTRGFDSPMTVYTVAATRQPIRTGNVVTVVPDYTIADCPAPDILVIPGGEVRELSGDTPLAKFLREQVPRVQVAFSVCNGAFCLADAGFLDGLEATTFSTSIAWLRQAAPRTVVHADRRFVDNGHIVTAAGVSAGIDGALHLIHRLLGADMARRAAHRMEYRWADDPGPEAAPTDRIVRARLRWYGGEWKQALEDYRAITADHPDDGVAMARLGTCQLFTRSGDALATLERAAAAPANATDGHLWHALGIAQQRSDQVEAAAQTFERALGLDPEAIDVRHDLGVAQCELGRHREAVANLTAALARGRGDVRTVVRLARSRLGTGDREGALRGIEREADDAALAALLAHQAFDPIRTEARFERLLQRATAASKPK